MVKVYKKKTNRKTKKCGGKNKKFSRKMKGGVAFNTSFSTSSLPSADYIPLNQNDRHGICTKRQSTLHQSFLPHQLCLSGEHLPL